MFLFHMNNKKYLFLFLFPYVCQAESKNDSFAEFDSTFIQGSTTENKIDVNQYNYGNPIDEGTYDLDIYVNNKYKGNLPVTFTKKENSSDATDNLCVTKQLTDLFDLKKNTEEIINNCAKLNKIIPMATANINHSVLSLNVSIPQAMLNNRPDDYISPSLWEDGIVAAFTSYDFNNFNYKTNKKTFNSQFLSLHGGGNIGGWAFRHDGVFNSGTDYNSHYSSQRTYAEHDLINIKSRLTVGDFTTGNDIMDNISLRGIKIGNDPQMLPQSERNFVPEIRGTANSNSRIQVRQAGNLIYETTVPPGPFNISTIRSAAYGGDLDVSILESDGSTRTFIVPFASTSKMLRSGTYRYSVAAGKYKFGNISYNDNIMKGTVQYGINNTFTVNGGVIVASDYTSGLMGLGLNLPIGALSTDFTVAQAKVNDKNKNGFSSHIAYSITLDQTSTYLSLAAYRYSSKNYFSLNDAMLNSKREYLLDNNIDFRFNAKSQYQLSISQPIYDEYGSMYLNAYKYSYWKGDDNTSQYQVGYNNNYKSLNYSVGLNKISSRYNKDNDTQVYVSLSLPLGNGTYAPRLSTINNHIKGRGANNSTTLSGQAGENNQFNYAVSSSMYAYQDNSYMLSGGYRSPYATFNASASSDFKGSTQNSATISGGIVAHPYGITLTNNLGDTFAIIHADHGKDAVINDSSNNSLDRWGNGIYGYLTPYEYNQVGIDTNNVSSDVVFDATQTKIIPRKNAIIMVKFNTDYGQATLVTLTRPVNKEIPMGSIIYYGNNKVGVVAQNGQVYLRNIKDNTKLSVKWEQNECYFIFNKPKESNKNQAGFFSLTQQCIEE